MNLYQFEKLEATSKHYFERIVLFEILGIKSDIKINEHESAGRFIPITKINNSDVLNHFRNAFFSQKLPISVTIAFACKKKYNIRTGA
ncbi:MAG: hypothetical protein WC860_02575 [Candidatus Margulisiibacteriota bacterium]|jgi:hypothetical protein